ncbi:MAG: hypothetical protein HYV09_21860 [Deltaproteobacteria bacterium]|nr:hypothetical protein [Deltaproteobacteria bacterium]
MDDADRLELTRLFVAAITAELKAFSEESVPMSGSAFAAAVSRLRDNPLASRFSVLTTVAGPMCPDFQEGMAIAQSAGLISRLNPSFQRFTVNLSGRQVRGLASDPQFAAARYLAKEYLALTLGSPDAGARDDHTMA